MKRITAIALLTIASCVTASRALASDFAVQANVPFDFIVGGKVLPAGTYKITEPSAGIIELQNRDKHIAVLSLAEGRDATKGNKLVFDRYGDRYFLSEVLCPGSNLTVQIPTSKMEKAAQRQEASIHDSGQTLVALK
jgi:hypothetical protein